MALFRVEWLHISFRLLLTLSSICQPASSAENLISAQRKLLARELFSRSLIPLTSKFQDNPWETKSQNWTASVEPEDADSGRSRRRYLATAPLYGEDASFLEDLTGLTISGGRGGSGGGGDGDPNRKGNWKGFGPAPKLVLPSLSKGSKQQKGETSRRFSGELEQECRSSGYFMRYGIPRTERIKRPCPLEPDESLQEKFLAKKFKVDGVREEPEGMEADEADEEKQEEQEEQEDEEMSGSYNSSSSHRTMSRRDRLSREADG